MFGFRKWLRFRQKNYRSIRQKYTRNIWFVFHANVCDVFSVIITAIQVQTHSNRKFALFAAWKKEIGREEKRIKGIRRNGKIMHHKNILISGNVFVCVANVLPNVFMAISFCYFIYRLFAILLFAFSHFVDCCNRYSCCYRFCCCCYCRCCSSINFPKICHMTGWERKGPRKSSGEKCPLAVVNYDAFAILNGHFSPALFLGPFHIIIHICHDH